VGGRLVRRIDAGVYPAGYRVATWDARDRHGRDVAAGIYFLRTTGDLGYQRTMKVSVLR
jgi:flagellar hook assembly protein FlgD